MTVIQDICLGESCLSRLQMNSPCKAGKSALCQYHFHYSDTSLSVTASAEPDLSLTVFHHLSQGFHLPQHKFCSRSQIILAPFPCHIKSLDSQCWSYRVGVIFCIHILSVGHFNARNRFSTPTTIKISLAKKKKIELGRK